MCRLGFLIFRGKPKEEARDILISSFLEYFRTNRDGFGISFAPDIYILRTLNPLEFLKILTDTPLSDSVIFHYRAATSGSPKLSNCHPFLSEDRDLALAHNGIINDLDGMKEELSKKGHCFSSEVDSEVFLHAYESYGRDFIRKMGERGISGYATLLIQQTDGTIYAYTDNSSLEIWRTTWGYFGLSDDFPLKNLKLEGIEKIEVKADHLYRISQDSMDDLGEIGHLDSPKSSYYYYHQTALSRWRRENIFRGYGDDDWR